MEKSEITKEFIRAITKVQNESGRPLGVIDSATKLVEDIQGFDSINGIEAVVILFKSLGCKPPAEIPFVSKDGKRSLSIAEISNNIFRFIRGEKDK